MPDLSPTDRDLIIRTIYGEALDQGPTGQAAVAHVIKNRMQDWGGSGRDTVLAPGQFEPWQTRSSRLFSISPRSSSYQQIGSVVDKVFSGQIPDPTGGSHYFLQPETVMQRYGRLPDWARGESTQIGAHRFFGGDVMGYAEDEKLPDLQQFLKSFRSINPVTTASAATAPATASDESAEELPDLGKFLKSWKGRGAQTEAPPSKTPALGFNPSKGGPLSEAPSDTTLQSIAKGAGTAALRGVADVYGMPGNLVSLGRAARNWLQPGALPGESPVPTSEQVGNWLTGQGQTGTLGSVLPPSPNLGSFSTQNPWGRLAMAAGEGAVGGLALGGPASGAISGAVQQGASDLNVNPYVGAGLGMLAGSAGPLTSSAVGSMSGNRIASQRALMQLAQDKYNIPLSAGNIAGPNTLIGRISSGTPAEALPRWTEEMSRVIGGDVNGNISSEITKQHLSGALTRAGKQMEDIEGRTSIPYDDELIRRTAGVYGDDPLVDSQIRGIMDRFSKGNGSLSGEDFHDILRKGSKLDRYARGQTSSTVPAQEVISSLRDAMERNAAPGDAQTYQTARTQYKVAKALEPMVSKGLPGEIDPGQFQTNLYREAGGMVGPQAPSTLRDADELADIGKMITQKSQGGFPAIANLLMHHPAALVAGSMAAGAGALEYPMQVGAPLAAVGVGTAALRKALEDEAFKRSLLSGRNWVPPSAGGLPTTLNRLTAIPGT